MNFVGLMTILDHQKGGFLSHGGSPVVTMLVLILRSTDLDDLSGTPPIFGNSKSLESLDTIIFHKWH